MDVECPLWVRHHPKHGAFWVADPCDVHRGAVRVPGVPRVMSVWVDVAEDDLVVFLKFLEVLLLFF